MFFLEKHVFLKNTFQIKEKCFRTLTANHLSETDSSRKRKVCPIKNMCVLDRNAPALIQFIS